MGDGEVKAPRTKAALGGILFALSELDPNTERGEVLEALRDHYCFHCLGPKSKGPDGRFQSCTCTMDD